MRLISYSREKIKMKTIAMIYSQRFSSSTSQVGESSSGSIELPKRSKSKLLDKDGGVYNCFKTASKIFLSPSKAKMCRLQWHVVFMLEPTRKSKGMY
jgi:hypothetical protein